MKSADNSFDKHRMVRQLGEGLGGRDPHASRDAHLGPHRLAHPGRMRLHAVAKAGQVNEGLVDRIHVEARRVAVQDLRHTGRKIPVYVEWTSSV